MDGLNIFTFKNEIDKLTLAKGLGRVHVNVIYDCNRLEKEIIIKYTNGYNGIYKENYIYNKLL